MALNIEDYAFIGDTQSGALVGRDGSIDWLCWPRFDSPACFAALLGDEQNGRWKIATDEEPVRISRRYRGETMILETDMETASGAIRIVDCMPPRTEHPVLVRLVHGLRGRVPVTSELRLRFDYGNIVPWVRRVEDAVVATAGPDAVALRTPVEHEGRDLATWSSFEIHAGQTVPFMLNWHASHRRPPRFHRSPITHVEAAEAWWSEWMTACTYNGGWQDAVRRSLVTLKALTFAPTGGIVAAPTTSLPEQLGGVRNWDYRYCWLRDATLTLLGLLQNGFVDEARAWREWLLRAVAGDPRQMQIMYGVRGERRLPETTLPWLSGYQGAAPVRIGNAAVQQFQLDVYGEVMDALHTARESGLRNDEFAWSLQRVLLDFLESSWSKPDEGLWEVRGPRRHFVHSKVMAWVAVDRAIKGAESGQEVEPAKLRDWRALRERIHREVCEKGFDAERNTFTQYYGSKELDAATMQIPLVGFLPPSDPRVAGTVDAVQRELCQDGFVMRYTTAQHVDGLPPGEGAFLACSFWLADNLTLTGRRDEAVELFERLLALRNDVGLLAEEWDAEAGRMTGNFPQAFSHVPLVASARHLSVTRAPEPRMPARPRR